MTGVQTCALPISPADAEFVACPCVDFRNFPFRGERDGADGQHAQRVGIGLGAGAGSCARVLVMKKTRFHRMEV